MPVRRLIPFLPVLIVAASATASPYIPEPPPPPPKVAIALEPGINSLGSLGGLAISYFPVGKIALEAGAGFGLLGLKAGLRARAFFLEGGGLHPYGGLSYMHAAGGTDFENMEITVKRNGSKHTYDFSMETRASDFFGILTGIELRLGRLVLRPGLGWSFLLQKRNWRVTAGEGPVDEDKKAVDILFGSGPTGFLGLGMGF